MNPSSIITMMDNLHQKNELQRGENGHYEVSWSKNIKERIIQFYFQLVRTNKEELSKLDTIYTNLIVDVITSDITYEERREYLGVLYKLIAYTRDIENGKGEYMLSYMMIFCWIKLQNVIQNDTRLKEEFQLSMNGGVPNINNIEYLFSDNFYTITNNLGYFAIKHFVSNDSQYECSKKSDTDQDITKQCQASQPSHPIGSYKDIKYFINYCRNIWNDTFSDHQNTDIMETDLMIKLIELVNSQLKQDFCIVNQYDDNNNNNTCHRENVSLVSKWIPREKSNKFGWMTKYFARQYFSDEKWFETANTITRQIACEKKTLKEYRKIVSKVNRYIDTVQIKQCSKKWNDIDFEKGVTSITLSKQKHAFLNIKKNNKIRFPSDEDRISCSEHYREFLLKCKMDNAQMKGKRVSIYDFVKDAIEFNDNKSKYELPIHQNEIKETINLQWKNNASINSSFNRLIAMVDTSGSMTIDNNTPLYNAIGLGIRIAERSTLGKRILTFNSKPEWFNLDDCNDFVSCVEQLQTAPWGMNTNFYLALEKILQAYVMMNLPPSDVENYGLVILSDMQIDHSIIDYSKTNMMNMFEEIEKRFTQVGLDSVYKTPYKLPLIVFWNLRKTNGFPVTSFTKNVAMISGYSPVLLNQFLNRGIEAFKEYNPWDIMTANIHHNRYNHFGTIIEEQLINNLLS